MEKNIDNAARMRTIMKRIDEIHGRYNKKIINEEIDLDPSKPSNILFDKIVDIIKAETKKMSDEEVENFTSRMRKWFKEIF